MRWMLRPRMLRPFYYPPTKITTLLFHHHLFERSPARDEATGADAEELTSGTRDVDGGWRRLQLIDGNLELLFWFLLWEFDFPSWVCQSGQIQADCFAQLQQEAVILCKQIHDMGRYKPSCCGSQRARRVWPSVTAPGTSQALLQLRHDTFQTKCLHPVLIVSGRMFDKSPTPTRRQKHVSDSLPIHALRPDRWRLAVFVGPPCKQGWVKCCSSISYPRPTHSHIHCLTCKETRRQQQQGMLVQWTRSWSLGFNTTTVGGFLPIWCS